MKVAIVCAFTAVGAVLAQTNGCMSGYGPGTDTVLFTTPYTYQQVMSIIGSFKNLTWSGNPDSTVTLDGPDNTVGTSRIYDVAGAHVIEKITLYSKPPNGPYNETHTLAPLTIPSPSVSFYGDYDGTTVTPVCNGKASAFNFTINFCATNVSLATSILHTIHLQDAQTVGVFLGGMNFSTCDAIGSNGTTKVGGSGNASITSSGLTPIRTAGAGNLGIAMSLVTAAVCAVIAIMT